ncbi:MAG: Na+/H+ antiporter NhaC family protein [Clostridia bacterium]|nr:Na+/H+ antiporter NhaC family protein [Clostridia bacterium]
MFKTRKNLVTAICFAAFLVLAVVLAIVCADTSVDEGSWYFGTVVSLVPPALAIALALVTKEVYSSLFLGVLVASLFAGNYSLTSSLDILVSDGLIAAVADNAGIFVFLVILGILVALINKAGGSKAFGKWAETHIKTRVGAMFATFILGVLIFIDDYFNCLTVGSVMEPVTTTHQISRAKLAYIIDATAAPICMIAPVSSWAAAVSGAVEDTAVDGVYASFDLFVRAIPFNFYSLLTIVFVLLVIFLGVDYGKMSEFEIKAKNGETEEAVGAVADTGVSANAKAPRVLDLVLPIAVLIVSCVVALMYVGGFFDSESSCYLNFIDAFGDTDAFVALPWGGVIALVFTVIYFILRRSLTFKEAMDAIPQGFIAMVSPILILTFATALKNVNNGFLGAKNYVAGVVEGAAGALFALLPAVIFLVACVLAFATGTSWGTFGILIPIVASVFPVDSNLLFVGISACLAGAVCGDHCSPISDTTIMASAGARCNHVDHVATQLPYAITVAAVSFVSFIIAGFIPNALIALPIAIALMVGTVFCIRFITNKKNSAN